MAQKKVWVTWMPAEETAYTPQHIVGLLGKYGLEVAGSKWVDDLQRMAWLDLETTLLDPSKADLWLIASDDTSLQKSSNRYALSLITAAVQEERGERFPILSLGLETALNSATMPTFLRSVPCLHATDQGWPAKVVAAAFTPPKGAFFDFRFGVRAHPLFGQWFEVGPRTEQWRGAMFGVTGDGTITHHAVGPKTQVPERTILEYQIQGMQVQIGTTTFTAWSVQNILGPEDSYYVRVEGSPQKIIVGGHAGEDQAEVFILELH